LVVDERAILEVFNHIIPHADRPLAAERTRVFPLQSHPLMQKRC
jgi:hypothetical protein